MYLKNGNPLTLESILYGLAAGIMLVSVLNWFSCYQVVMTSDKFIYLFGKVIPAMSLIFSMVLRFVPKFKNGIKKSYLMHRNVFGRDVTNGNVLDKGKAWYENLICDDNMGIGKFCGNSRFV